MLRLRPFHLFRNEKSAQRESFAGRPCGHPAKNFGQALKILEKNNKHFGTDISLGFTGISPFKKLTRVHSVVNRGGVVKTLRRRNSLSCGVFSSAASFR